MLLLFVSSHGMAMSRRTVTLTTLLAEMTDVEAVARWPQPAFTCREASSYDRARLAPDKPGWFSNNDSSQYLRTETIQGRRELVMLDADGPGAIVRFWITTDSKRAGKLRIYLDANATPALEIPAYDLMASHLTESPLLHPHTSYDPNGGGGNTLYLPIPYALHCKVTWEEADPRNAGPRYYQINYRTYAPGTEVETFTTGRLEAAHHAIAQTNRLLTTPPTYSRGKIVSLVKPLEPGAGAILDLPPGANTIRDLELQVTTASPRDRDQALRSTILQMTFDGEATVWCPVSDFAGCGVGSSELRSWYRTVDREGRMTFRWVMPYARSGQIMLSNLGAKPISITLHGRVGGWHWDARSMHFHANWRQQAGVPTKPDSDWNFNQITGGGVLVGDVLAVFNPVAAWYGEGNEKIWVDRESFPSHLGTGTEDYYNASWAPTPVYQTPFANGPRVDDPKSQGNNTYTRTRNLDTIPFRQALQFDMEIEHWQDPKIDIAAVTYWYGFPGALSNRKPMPEEAVRPIRRLAPPFKIAGAIECEDGLIRSKTEGMFVGVQDMLPFSAPASQSSAGSSSDLSPEIASSFSSRTWSGNAQLLGKAMRPGDFVELQFSVPGGPHNVTLYATRAPDFGTLRFLINGLPATQDFDGYAPKVMPSGPVSLGTFEAREGILVIRVEVAGANSAATGAKYFFGLDCLVLEDAR